MEYIDLHIHSNYSDGSDSPAEIVRQAKNMGISAISISDHDTILGQIEAIDTAKRLGIEYITGIEFSSLCDNVRFHILGYRIDIENENLIKITSKLIEERGKRANNMLDKLYELGFPMRLEDVLFKVTNKNIGRLHFAKVMVDKGYVRNTREAFDLYLGYGKPAYVPKWVPTSREIIELIHNANGFAVLAHPGIFGQDILIPKLIEWELDGIEAYYPEHSQEKMEYYKYYARKHGLFVSGGSDSHGKVDGKPMVGEFKYSYSILEEMKERF